MRNCTYFYTRNWKGWVIFLCHVLFVHLWGQKPICPNRADYGHAIQYDIGSFLKNKFLSFEEWVSRSSHSSHSCSSHRGTASLETYLRLYCDCLWWESNFFGFNAPVHCLVLVRLLHCMRVRLRNGYTRAYMQIMQHTHMHKVVAGRTEAKKLLSRRRQSKYS